MIKRNVFNILLIYLSLISNISQSQTISKDLGEFWKVNDILKNVSMSALVGESATSLTSNILTEEIFNGKLELLIGLSKAKDKDVEAIESLINGGGNFVLSYHQPVLKCLLYKSIGLRLFLNGRFSYGPSIINQNVNVRNETFSLSFDWTLKSKSDKLLIHPVFSINSMSGDSEFIRLFSIENKRAFYFQTSIYMAINKTISLAISFPNELLKSSEIKPLDIKFSYLLN